MTWDFVFAWENLEFLSKEYQFVILQLVEHDNAAMLLYQFVIDLLPKQLGNNQLRLTPFPGFPGFLQKFMGYLLPLMVA